MANSFYSMFRGHKKSSQDLSREEEVVYKEIPPYAKDLETGELLNDSPVPKLVENGKVNIQEKIQSFKDDVDIYKILEKYAYSGNPEFITKRAPQKGDIDISQFPDNINDFDYMSRGNIEILNSLDHDIASAILDEKKSSSDVANMIIEKKKKKAASVVEPKKDPTPSTSAAS